MAKIKDDIQYVVFDIYGVIITAGHNIRDILFPIFPKHKSHRFSRRIYHYYAENKLKRANFWSLLGNFDSSLENKFYERHRLDKDFYQVIEQLKKQSKKLYILSNIPQEWSEYLNKKFKFDKYFSGTVFSWQVGKRKPDPKIFNYLVKKYTLPVGKTLFIDDNIDNIRMAKRLGFRTCWFNRDKIDLKPTSADFIINELKKLIEII